MSIKYYQISIDVIIEKLKDILSTLPEVKIAVLFGSSIRREFVRDIDIGVLLSPKTELKDIIRIANILEDKLGIPFDIVPLEKAPPKLRLKILLNGKRLIVRDSKLYASLISEALSEVVDMDIKLKEKQQTRIKC